MRSLAFIPARGGSKRLHGKNIKSFGGFPLIYYSIAFARHNHFTKIIVSTDDDEIEAVAESFGAAVLRRPSSLSSDTATTGAAAEHCLNTEREKGFEPDVFVTLQPTNPLRPKNLYQEASTEYFTNNYDSVISVGLNKHKFGIIQNGHYVSQNYTLGNRSQDLAQLYFENGLLYVTKPEVIMRQDIFGQKIKAIVTEEPYALVDIDDNFDFRLGESLLSMYKEEFSYLLK
jgi:CMP-N-acetylneuraminic acid synthetase